ncbi:TetR/AcrR family transcriptional regulator [Hyphococcus flavus]|uniref:TetR/AcrR family transcriptional regulator n=1 Tax=Hyphococcus flavus TaxID=1866326 RepID=A0AAF0CGW7_9PROT|nr:TetR/AcrR family transcriptional regulator [Hyphococcus flavus]WDI32743.1 TetR/AcrR family transcriptional regulator [Hyphococcus flavus]
MQRARTDEAKEARRLAILTAALDEFFERGFAAARMDDIAARAGFSKGTIYLYFDSKEALFTGLVETFALPNIEMMEAAAKGGGGLSAIRALLKFAPVIIRDTPVPKLAKVLIGDAPAFPEMATAYREKIVDRVIGMVAASLGQAKAAGEIDIDDPALTARIVVAPIILSAVWRVVFEHDAKARIDLEALFSIHEKMLMRALGVSEAAHA